MNPPGGNRPPPGPPGAWPGHGAPPQQPHQQQGPYGQPQQGPYGHPQQQQQQQPYGHNPYGPPPGAYPAPPPPQHQYPQAPPGAYPQQHGYPQYPHPQQPMIVVQNHVNPYGGGMMYPDARKKDTALLLAIVGLLFGICGMHKFYLRQTGMGVLYFFTGGLCAIGQIIDIISLATMSQQEFDMRFNVMGR
jgi:hypothetical protein